MVVSKLSDWVMVSSRAAQLALGLETGAEVHDSAYLGMYWGGIYSRSSRAMNICNSDHISLLEDNLISEINSRSWS